MKKLYFKAYYIFYYQINLAEKLPKNETTNTTGQGRRLVESEGANKSLSSCCK